MRTSAGSLILCITFLTAGREALAQMQDVKAALAKSIWTAETIRAVRAANDYKALLALIITEKADPHFSSDALKQAIAKAQHVAEAIPNVSIDPDLNPTAFREMLQRLYNSGALANDVLNDLIRELSRSPADRIEEDIILGETTVATKAIFANFMQKHVMAVYDIADEVRVRPILTDALGDIRVTDTHTDLTTLVKQSHLPEGGVKTTVLAMAASGNADAAALRSAATGALHMATTHFGDACNTFQSIVSSQPPFDSIVGPSVPLAIQGRVAAANKLLSSTPDQLVQFDTLRTMANLLPLPSDVSNTIQTVAQVGSTIESTVSTISHVASSLSAIGNLTSLGMSFLTTGGFGALAGSLGSVFGGGGPSNQEILDAVNKVGQQVQQLHTEMVSRFDQVDTELKAINKKLDNGFAALGSKLADIHADLKTVVATTGAIELTILEDRDTLQRAVINNIGAWENHALQELHRNLVKLLDALDRANVNPGDLSRTDFRTLAEYFTTLARTEALQSPLNGLEAAQQDYKLENAALRITRQDNLYPLNYTMSFPIAGLGGPTLQAMVSGPEAARKLLTKPYVNERVWAIAANAIAMMIERWPSFANEIPGLRDGFDGIVRNGKDLASLVKALQPEVVSPNHVSEHGHSVAATVRDAFPTPPASKPLTKPFSATLQVYEAHVNALRRALQAALVDEATVYMATLGLDTSQRDALRNAFSATETVNGREVNAVTQGAGFIERHTDYSRPSTNVTLCGGQGPTYQISGAPLSGPGLEAVTEALVLNTGVLSACLDTPLSYVSERQETVPNHGGYGILGQGKPCAADSVVTFMSLEVDVRLMFRLASDPDDPAHWAVIGEASANGPETETESRVIGQPHWSGQPTEGGHDWNSECGVWAGRTSRRYIGDAAYINANWGTLAPAFSRSYSYTGSFPYASGNRQTIMDQMQSENRKKLLAIYSNALSDLGAVLHQPTPNSQNRIAVANVKAIVGEVHSLEGLRALLRQLTTIAYERTLSTDDVLSGLLFGTDSLPGALELEKFAFDCERKSDPDQCLAELAKLPLRRSKRLAERLSLVNGAISAGTSPDSHKLIDITLNRLSNARCLVPTAYNGEPDCNAHR